jgi:hypothetical protein
MPNSMMSIEHILQSKRNWLVLVGFLLLTFWMGSRELAGVFWVDETRAAYRAGDPRYGGEDTLAEVWERSANVYDQTPGYYIVLALWGRVVGLGEYTGRSLSLFAGILAVAVTYRLGCEIHSRLAGLSAAVVMGSSAMYLLYLHDMRTYALIVLMAALGMWSYWRLTTRRPKPLFYGLLLLALVLLLYAHYFASIIVGALGLYHLVFGKRDKTWWRLLLVFVAAVLSFLPWIANVARILSGAGADVLRQMGAYDLRTAVSAVLYYFSNGGINLVVVLCILGLSQVSQRGVRLAWFVLAGGLALALLVNAFLQMLAEVRYLLVLWVPLSLVCGVGFARLSAVSTRSVWMLCGGLLLVSGVWNNFDHNARLTLDSPNKYLPWDDLADVVHGRDESGDVLIFSFEFMGWDGDHWETSAHYLYDSQIEPFLLRSLPAMTDQTFLQEAQGYIQNATRVWSAFDNTRRPWRMGMFETHLTQQGFYDCGIVVDNPDLHIDLFSRIDEQPLPYVFNAEGRIEVALLETLPERVDDSLPFTLGWKLGEGVPPNTYSLGLHLLDSGGGLVAQFDYGIAPQAAGCVTSTIDMSSLVPGDYNLNLIAYAWETGTRLEETSGDASQPQQSISLGTIRVD